MSLQSAKREIVSEITKEIERLTSVRDSILGLPETTTPNMKGRAAKGGTGKGSSKAGPTVNHLSPATRKKISDAIKAKWAAKRRAAAKSSPK